MECTIDMAKIAVVLGSPRKGNSETIAMKVAEAAKANGNEIEVFRINDLKNAKGCQACMGCKKAGKCVIKDDMLPVLDAVRNADGIIVAAADYFGQPCSQYRMFEDRMYSFIDGSFVPNITPKKVAVVVTCGMGLDGAKAMADSMEGVFVNFFKCQSVGKIVLGGGLAPNVAAENAEILAQTEELGKKF